MKLSEIPQDENPAYEGGKKLCYAVNDAGHVVQSFSSGWQVESDVQSLAWRKIEKDLRATKLRVQQGLTSPLEYHMKNRQMDVGLLAQNMGISRLRVRWHLRPRVFRKLKLSWIKKYADCLAMSEESLPQVDA